ncbi:peptide ABC transporter substrate-binding protein [Metallumcola ferriviriculae]|uniref:Peptide ABC transporter substrate-binding protein n=1 Tax=Metallumcola ferriviriculae TaxID=3039180 RepID=A0AAU0ULT9_9FIRM|nr:peptide ABC transporter substrate-binding protein [Desulfitibacteraceae bacterium MK1]
MLRKSKLLFVVALTLVVVFALAGCGAPKNEGKGSDNAGKEEVKQKITYNLGSEPETLDPGKVTGNPDMTAINAMMEGLTRYNMDGELEPAMAKDWDISPDGTVYTFKIREDAKWSNGDPVTAEDFEFAWRQILDPEFAADYAYELYYLKNAAAYNDFEDTSVTSPDQIGVEAVDAKTLEVTLAAPAPQFLGLTAFPAYFPVHKATATANPDWHAEPETYVNNGPFKMTVWEHDQKIVFEKNETYWDKDSVRLDELVMTLVSSESTELAMFETGDIDVGDNPPNEEMDRLKADANYGLTIGGDLSTYYYVFNTTAKPFDDVRVRKALTMAIDREAIVENIAKAGQIPAFAYVPFGLDDADKSKDFREEGGNDYFAENLEKAQELLAEAGYPNGEGFPEFEILNTDRELYLNIAQAIQEMWKQNLGIEGVKVISQEWGSYLKARAELDYLVAAAGWGADYADPMTFLDMYIKDGGNNDTGWSDERYDQSIAKANSTNDQAVRMQAMHEAEDILMEAMPLMPIYFYTNPYIMKDYVKDVVVPDFGPNMDFKWAYVEK